VILVTGATGFLGRNLCEYLVEQNLPFRALARTTSNYAFLEKLGIEVVFGDVRDKDSLRAALKGCDEVIHAAAKFRMWGPRQEFYKNNVEGTRHMLDAALKAEVRRFVYVSTIAVIGPPPPGVLIDESTPCHPADFYQRTKLSAERMSLGYYVAHGLPVVVPRLGAFYGPWGHYAFNRLFFEEFLRGWRVQVHRGRRLTFPLYVKDAAWGIVSCLKRGRLGELYNFADKSRPHREIDQTVSEISKKRYWRPNVPQALMIAVASIMEAISHFTHREPWYPLNLANYVFYDWNVSSEKAKREFGFRPTPFTEGALKTLQWYAAQGYRGLDHLLDKPPPEPTPSNRWSF
jgi:dihydroflavonol-4-reductase